MADIVVAHGAWSAGWAWKKMRPLLREAGHELFTPSYTGLGERSHLATPEVGLSTHIQDIVNVIEFEDLHEVVLLGHSYGGMVATGVADRLSDRISQVIYLDAFVPRDGQALRDFTPPRARKRSAPRPRLATAGASRQWPHPRTRHLKTSPGSRRAGCPSLARPSRSQSA